jgi:hypothetical protein
MLLNPLIQRRDATPKSEESCGRVKPLVVAIRTASARNSSVYFFAIPHLLHSKHCSEETGTETGQDQSVGAMVPFLRLSGKVSGPLVQIVG